MERKLQIGDLRRWKVHDTGREDTPFLLVSIEGLDVTVMDEGETYQLNKATVEEFSERMEVPNDKG